MCNPTSTGKYRCLQWGCLTNENSLLIQGSECDVYIILHILAAETCEHYVYWICFMNYNGIQTLGKDHTM